MDIILIEPLGGSKDFVIKMTNPRYRLRSNGELYEGWMRGDFANKTLCGSEKFEIVRIGQEQL
jgi:hypothetical protein